MKISAIIPAFNAEKYLARAVNSLIGTSYPDLEIIIVNDGSADNTWDVAQGLSRQHRQVQIFNHEDGKNHGVSAARNLGMARSSGELVCFLDADDYVLPHRFDVAVPLLAAHPEVDAVHELAKMEFGQAKGSEAFWDKDQIFGIRAQTMEVCSPQNLLAGVCWSLACILLRRKFLEKTGNFPENFRFAEDYHLWLRMVCLGTVVAGNDREPVSVYYRHSENTYYGGVERKVDMIRAMVAVYRIFGSRRDLRIDRKEMIAPICSYINYTLIRAREEQRCNIGRKAIRTVLLHGFSPAMFDSRVRRQMAWVLVGRNANEVRRDV